MCDKGFIWNPSNGECECDKVCETFEEVKLAKITLAKDENNYNVILAYYILCYFRYFLQLMLEWVLILFVFIGT